MIFYTSLKQTLYTGIIIMCSFNLLSIHLTLVHLKHFSCPIYHVNSTYIEIHFCISSILPLVACVLLFFVVKTKLKEWGASLKGRPRSLPLGLLHQCWQKAVWTIGKCFIGHDTLCSWVRATLNFSLTPSMLHFYCPARLLTNLQP